MKSAINQLPYQAALKVGLQMKRRFWEQDEQIYGGHTYTNQANSIIGYPMWDYFSRGKGVLLGAYTFGEPAFVADTCRFLAQLRGEDADELADATRANFHRLFAKTLA